MDCFFSFFLSFFLSWSDPARRWKHMLSSDRAVGASPTDSGDNKLEKTTSALSLEQQVYLIIAPRCSSLPQIARRIQL